MTSSPTHDSEDISQCPSCYCMTHTVDGHCGKCKAEKLDAHDSEDWLDAAIEEALPKALRVVYSNNLKRKLLKDAVLAHYAHYLKPEDVEHWVKHEARVTTAQGIDGISDGQYVNVKYLLSKLNREEKQ